MNRIIAVILMIVLAVASATAGIRHYCDYQGNIRQVADAQGNVLEQNDYYPYGGLFGESASRQSYKYSGKELETMNGLNTYDFHARPYYYPVLQFHSPDILGETYYHVSPYLYCSGNPINRIDPTGMVDYFNQKGKFIMTIDDGLDVRMMLFLNSTNIEDAQKAISEKLYTPVPSETVIKAMEQVYEKTEKTGNEAGFIVGESGTVSRIVEGTSGEIDNETWGIAQKDIIESNDMISYDVHSHPEQNQENVQSTIVPSDEDINNLVGNMPGVILGHYYKNIPITNQIGGFQTIKYRGIGFFNSSGAINVNNYDFNSYKRTINKINKYKK